MAAGQCRSGRGLQIFSVALFKFPSREPETPGLYCTEYTVGGLRYGFMHAVRLQSARMQIAHRLG